jgi:hypothetical protein
MAVQSARWSPIAAVALLMAAHLAAATAISPRSFLRKPGHDQEAAGLPAKEAGPVLVTGATGRTGSLIYKALKDSGVEVRDGAVAVPAQRLSS